MCLLLLYHLMKKTIYILFILLIILNNAVFAQDFKVFTETELNASKKIPVAILLDDPNKSNVSVSILDIDNKLCGFTEGQTCENGFACLKILTPDKQGDYILKTSVGKEKKFKTKEQSIKIKNTVEVSLNAIPVREDDHLYIYVLGEFIKPSINEKCLISLSSKGENIYSKTIFTDEKGNFVCKIPVTYKKNDYLLTINILGHVKTLAVRTDFENKESIIKEDDIYINLLPQSTILSKGFINRFEVVIRDPDGKPISCEFNVSSKNFSRKLQTDEKGHSFFDFKPEEENQSFDISMISLSGKKILKKFTFPVSESDIYIYSDVFTVNQGEIIDLNIQTSKNNSILLSLKSESETIDYFNFLPTDKIIKLNTKNLNGVYSLENQSGKKLYNFVVFPKKENTYFKGLQKSYIPGQPLVIKTNYLGKNIFALFSKNQIKKTLTFINFINKASEKMLDLSYFIDEFNDFSYGRIFFYQDNFDISQFVIPQSYHKNNEILKCIAFKDNELSLSVPFDYFNGFISFSNIESEILHSEPFNVINDFSLKLPALDYGQFTKGDYIKFPVKFTNHTDIRGKIETIIAERDSLKINGNFKQTFSLEGNQDGYAYYDITFTEPSDAVKIALGANFYNSYKEIRGNLFVKPQGYREDSCLSFVISDNIKLSKENNQTLYLYNSAYALAEDTLSALYNKPQFSSFNLIGCQLIANDFKIKSDENNKINNFITKEGVLRYRHDQNIDIFLTNFTDYAFPNIPKQYDNLKVKKCHDRIKELISYYFIKNSVNKLPEKVNIEEVNEPVIQALELYLNDSFSEKDVNHILSKISSVGSKSFFHTSNPIFSDYDTSLSNIEATALITYLLPKKYISSEIKEKILNYLVESRLPDKTWGNAVSSWITLCAIKKLTDEKPSSGNIFIKSEKFEEKIHFYDEHSIKSLPIKDNIYIDISENKEIFLGFLSSYSYKENLKLSNKMTSIDFNKDLFNSRDKIITNFKWDFPDKKSPALISFTIPWGTIYSESSAQLLKEENCILDYIQLDKKIYILVKPKGSAILNLTALFPCRISVDCLEIEGVLNSRIKGKGISKILEIN